MAKITNQYKLEPPEGGWGFLVCVGMALAFINPLSAHSSFGLLFGDFLKNLGEETSAIAVITMSFFSAMSFAGLFSSSLFKRYSIRTVGVAGGIIYFLGTFLQIFVQSTWQLFIAFSVFQGVGFGLTVPTSYTTFNNYFVRKRVMMMSVAQTLIGIGTMVYPILVKELLEAFGFRGCLAVIAALNAHCILGMCIMHPVEWHMRKVPIDDEELTEIVKNNINQSNEKCKENIDAKSNGEHLEPLMPAKSGEIKIENHKTLQEITKSSNNSKRNSLERVKSLERRGSKRASSIASLGNWSGPVVVNDVSERDAKPTGKWKLVVDFLDLTLLKKPIYVNIVLGITFALYSDVAFFTLQPMYLFEIGYSKADTALIVAIGACADLSSRIVLALSSAFVSVSARYVYLAGAFFTVIARFAFLTVFDFTKMAIITAVMGFLRTWIHVTLPLVFAEYLPKERFSSGYGLFMFLQGNIMFVIGPIIGYIRDSTNSYPITFHCINLFMAACAFPWIAEILYLKYKNKSNMPKIKESEL